MIPSSPAAARIAGSSLTRSGRAASISAPASRPQPRKTSLFQPGSDIDEQGEGDEPADDGQQEEAVADREPGGRAGPVLDDGDLQIAQHACDHEGHGEEELVAMQAR